MARKKVQEGLSDMAMKAEMDHEVQMARSDLFKIAKYAVELHDMLKSVSEAEGIEGWQQSKITKAADYLGSVYHSMDYEVNVTESDTEDKTHDVNNDGKVNSDDYKAAKDKAIKKALKKPSINETMLRQIKKAILFQEGKIGRANMSPKAFKLAEMHHKDLAVLKADFENKVLAEGKYGEITHHDEDPTRSEVLVKGMGKYTMGQLEQRLKDRLNNVIQLLDRGEPDQAARLLDANSGTYKSLIAMLHAYSEAHDDLAFGDHSQVAGIGESKKKKPDADGDGVPDWADKKPGKDDNAKKKTESVEGVCEDCGNPSWKTLPEEKKKGSHGKVCWKGWRRGKGNSCHKVKGDD